MFISPPLKSHRLPFQGRTLKQSSGSGVSWMCSLLPLVLDIICSRTSSPVAHCLFLSYWSALSQYVATQSLLSSSLFMSLKITLNSSHSASTSQSLGYRSVLAQLVDLVLGMDLKSSCTLGKHSLSWATPHPSTQSSRGELYKVCEAGGTGCQCTSMHILAQL